MFGNKVKEPEKQPVIFEKIADKGGTLNLDLRRCKVPNGWLVATVQNKNSSLTFIPDVNHEWEVKTL